MVAPKTGPVSKIESGVEEGGSGMGRSRKVHTAVFKARLGLIVLKVFETVSQLASRHNVHSTQILQ